jgi:hypothetical protein
MLGARVAEVDSIRDHMGRDGMFTVNEIISHYGIMHSIKLQSGRWHSPTDTDTTGVRAHLTKVSRAVKGRDGQGTFCIAGTARWPSSGTTPLAHAVAIRLWRKKLWILDSAGSSEWVDMAAWGFHNLPTTGEWWYQGEKLPHLATTIPDTPATFQIPSINRLRTRLPRLRYHLPSRSGSLAHTRTPTANHDHARADNTLPSPSKCHRTSTVSTNGTSSPVERR